MSTLKIDKTGVYIDGHKIDSCVSINIRNINRTNPIEAELHIVADELDVQYGNMGRGDERRT